MSAEEITDSSTKWVADHVKRYLETDGASGHLYHGIPTLLLTTRGRKSGLMRRTALIYGQDGDRYLLVPSNGGSDTHPAWYLNLLADPAAQVQVLADKFTARATTADDTERPRLWELMAKVFPQYRTYQRNSARDIPVVVLERR